MIKNAHGNPPRVKPIHLVPVVLLLCGSTANISAGDSPKLNAVVTAVLQAEADGKAVDRRVLITTDDVASLWHRGILNVQGEQVEYEALELTPAEKEYLEKRASTESSWSNFKLAMWCKSKGLLDQTAAHLNAILFDQPNNSLVRDMLGHTFDQGYWYTPEERHQATEQAARVSKAIAHWMPRLTRLTKQLSSTSAQAKLKAIDELAGINDPNAVHALELIIPTLDENLGGLLTNQVGTFSTQSACQALVRIALHDNVRPSVAENAARQLGRFHRDLYVPDLLGMLVEPGEAKSEITTLPNGNLLLNRLVIREIEGRKELHKYKQYIDLGEAADIQVAVMWQSGRVNVETREMRTSYRLSLASKQTRCRIPFIDWKEKQFELIERHFFDPDAKEDYSSEIQADEKALFDALKTNQQILDSQLASIRKHVADRNTKVMRLLETTQRESPGSSPSDWWTWWADVNDRFLARKPVTVFEKSDIQANQAFEAAEVSATIRTFGNCLAAGTLIQASRGLIPIEEIRIGDLLMSQDAETGELRLKPVFQIASRPPASTLWVETEQEKLQATPGHVWWVSGKGWLRTQELQPGMLLYTARGNIPIKAVHADDNPSKTYNLVVADFNTYFVGNSRILVYDNNPLKPTMRAVPGFGAVSFQ